MLISVLLGGAIAVWFIFAFLYVMKGRDSSLRIAVATILLLMVALTALTPVAHAVTNSEASVTADMMSREIVPLCKAELDANPDHRAKYFFEQTGSKDKAMLVMIVCSTYLTGFLDGTFKAKDPTYDTGFNKP